MTTTPARPTVPDQSREERMVREALLSRARAISPYDTIMVSPQHRCHVREKTFVLDLLVTYRGHSLAIEVDDPSHYKRYAADASRDALVRDAGVETYRIVLEDVLDPLRLEDHVDRIMSRLCCHP